MPARLADFSASSASAHVVTYSIRTITPSRKVAIWWYSSVSISMPLLLAPAAMAEPGRDQVALVDVLLRHERSSPMVSSIPLKKRMHAGDARAESKAWCSGSTQSMSGSKLAVARSKSRSL